jgi:hypothetical protein
VTEPKGPTQRVDEILGRPFIPGTIDSVLRPAPTAPADWILSFRETRRELRCYRGLEAPAGRLFQRAGLECYGSAHLMRDAILELVARGILHPVRYAPWMPAPTLMGDGTAPHNRMLTDTWEGRRTHPLHWIYRVASVLPEVCFESGIVTRT